MSGQTETVSAAVEVARAYHRAWAGGDFAAAMRHVSPDIVCASPGGLITGAEAFSSFMGPFAAMATATNLLAAYGDDQTAVIIYDTQTPHVADAPGAELHTVVDGRIVRMKIIFDRLPFEQARHQATDG